MQKRTKVIVICNLLEISSMAVVIARYNGGILLGICLVILATSAFTEGLYKGRNPKK